MLFGGQFLIPVSASKGCHENRNYDKSKYHLSAKYDDLATLYQKVIELVNISTLSKIDPLFYLDPNLDWSINLHFKSSSDKFKLLIFGKGRNDTTLVEFWYRASWKDHNCKNYDSDFDDIYEYEQCKKTGHKWDECFNCIHEKFVLRIKIGNFSNLMDPDGDGLNSKLEYQIGTNPYNPDTDGDGMPDGWEYYHGLNPLLNDSLGDPDLDGLTNLQEYQIGTHPMILDTDNDGIPDGWEYYHGLNPLLNDSLGDPDLDGLTNLQEYQIGTHPMISDTDNDGLSDGTEVNFTYTNPLLWDTDQDGMPDGWEVNVGLNPLLFDSQLDPDNDMVDNLHEYLAGTNPFDVY
jgi:hypothetical protein